MDRITAINLTNEAIGNLTRTECKSIFKESGYNVSKLIEIINLKYPELSGWYYDSECTMFCKEKIVRHIVKESVEMVSAECF